MASVLLSHQTGQSKLLPFLTPTLPLINWLLSVDLATKCGLVSQRVAQPGKGVHDYLFTVRLSSRIFPGVDVDVCKECVMPY